ncbi:phage capsid protein [Pontibacillus sp. HMF3514]|nr:phage capsid protein [Pontibacillus sp. HMF3514]
MRQEELKKNPGGNLNDGFNRDDHMNLVDLVGGLGWKKARLLMLVIILAFFILLIIV